MRSSLQRLRLVADQKLNPDVATSPLLVVATGPFIGEGFDCPALDTLFLASPIAFKGRLVQYVGRVLRPHPGKSTAEVHDYQDIHVGVLASSLAKRARPAAMQLDCNIVILHHDGMPEAAPNYHGFLTMQSRGVLALPPELRRRYQLDRPGAQVEITERPDGVLEVRPTLAIPANQAWFWTDAWQKREREADADIAAGRVTSYDDVDALLDDLPS